MISQEILQRIKEIVISCLDRNKLELVEIAHHGRRRPQVTVLIDRPEGGVTIEECALMNTLISEALDCADILNSAYVLEVSSPGADRQLNNKNDFYRAISRKVKCSVKESIGAKNEIDGLVKSAGDECVTLETEDGDIKIPYTQITKAKQIIK